MSDWIDENDLRDPDARPKSQTIEHARQRRRPSIRLSSVASFATSSKFNSLLGFNSTFLREMRMIVQATEQSERAPFPEGPLERRLRQMNFHVIEAEALMTRLAADSALNAYLPFIRMLRDQGRVHAEIWLGKISAMLASARL